MNEMISPAFPNVEKSPSTGPPGRRTGAPDWEQNDAPLPPSALATLGTIATPSPAITAMTTRFETKGSKAQRRARRL